MMLENAIELEVENKNRNKILVVGESSVKVNILYNLFKEYGVSKNRVEVITDFDKIKRMDMDKLKKYKLILMGPIPHSSKSKEYNSSMLTNLFYTLDNNRVEKLECNGRLKITKSNFKEILLKLKNDLYLNLFIDKVESIN